MSTAAENSQKNWYVYCTPERKFSEVITYRKNVILELKKFAPDKFDSLDENRTAEADFQAYLEMIRQAGYEVYELRKA